MSGSRDQDLVGLVPRRLTTPKRVKFPSKSKPVRMALSWQTMGARADFWGMGGQPERMYEIGALMAAMGEQLGLAALADHEMTCWQALGPPRTRHQGVEREMAMRSVVELLGHHVLALGHMVGNLACRAFALDGHVRPALKQKLKSDFPPASSSRSDWMFLSTCAKKLPEIAQAAAHRDLEPAAEIVRNLYEDDRRRALDTLRGEDFHQWRPQSAGLRGAPKGPFGEDHPGGGKVYSFRGGTVLGPETGAPLAAKNYATTAAAFALIVDAMEAIDLAIDPPIERLTSLRFKRT